MYSALCLHPVRKMCFTNSVNIIVIILDMRTSITTHACKHIRICVRTHLPWLQLIIMCDVTLTSKQLTKFTKVKEFPLLETALFFLMSYCSFQAAEAAAMTGRLSVVKVGCQYFRSKSCFQGWNHRINI